MGLALYVIDDLTPYQVIYLNLHDMIANLFKVNVVHLIITHCHDDHIGGFKYSYKRFSERYIIHTKSVCIP